MTQEDDARDGAGEEGREEEGAGGEELSAVVDHAAEEGAEEPEPEAELEV